MDDLTPEQRKKNMQHIRSKNTEIELLWIFKDWVENNRG